MNNINSKNEKLINNFIFYTFSLKKIYNNN